MRASRSVCVLAAWLAGDASADEPVALAPATSVAVVAATPAPSITVTDLQHFRQVTQGRAALGSASAVATLTDLNPVMHAWYLLEIHQPDGLVTSYHLHVPEGRGERLLLDAVDGSHLLITGAGPDIHCDLSGSENLLVAARRHCLMSRSAMVMCTCVAVYKAPRRRWKRWSNSCATVCGAARPWSMQ